MVVVLALMEGGVSTIVYVHALSQLLLGTGVLRMYYGSVNRLLSPNVVPNSTTTQVIRKHAVSGIKFCTFSVSSRDQVKGLKWQPEFGFALQHPHVIKIEPLHTLCSGTTVFSVSSFNTTVPSGSSFGSASSTCS